MTAAQRLCLRILLWLAGAVILGSLAMLIYMQINLARHGDGGEMAEGIALFLGLALIGFYSIVLALGRIMLQRGGASWGWFFVAVTVVLVASPVLFIWWLRG